MVELRGQLSNPPGPLLRMLEGASSQVSRTSLSTESKKPRQRQVRLSRQRELELVSRYQAGALQRELAKTYGVHRRTVAAIVKRHGALRPISMSEAEIAEAVLRYQMGDSLAVIGKALGVDHSTVRNYLVKHGVRMRDTHGREK